MFPSSFEYMAPKTVDEAVGLLQQYGYDAKILAGGQSLLPMMKLRIAMPTVVIDINQIKDLQVCQEENGYLRIGALVRHADLEHNQELIKRYPLLAKTAEVIADPPIRNRGTLCGSLVHADPNSDWGAAMLALQADVEITGPAGKRIVSINDFFVDTFTTPLEIDELVSAVLIPQPAGKSKGMYMKLERKAGDFAIVAAAINVTLSDNGTVLDAGIGLGACGDVPIRARQAEQILIGSQLDNHTIEQAAQVAKDEANPSTDLRGTAEYKKDLVRVFVKRALNEIGGN